MLFVTDLRSMVIALSYRRAIAKISCVGPERRNLAVAAKKGGAL